MRDRWFWGRDTGLEGLFSGTEDFTRNVIKIQLQSTKIDRPCMRGLKTWTSKSSLASNSHLINMNPLFILQIYPYLIFRIPFLVRNRKYPFRRKALLHFLPYQNRTRYLRRLLPLLLPLLPLHNFLFRRRLLILRLRCRLYFLLSLLLRCLLRLTYLRRRRLVLLRRLLIRRRRLLFLRIIRLLLLLR